MHTHNRCIFTICMTQAEESENVYTHAENISHEPIHRLQLQKSAVRGWMGMIMSLIVCTAISLLHRLKCKMRVRILLFITCSCFGPEE